MILLIDSSNTCWRSYYALKQVEQAATFGFLREITTLQNRLPKARFVFTFDRGESRRKRFYPFYKSSRKDKTPEERAVRKKVHNEIRRLRDEILPDLGFSNVFSQSGYEADDVIASVCKGKGEYVIVSSDRDLYQLLESNRVRLWLPSKGTFFTWQDLRNQFGIESSRWHCVKAIAGCSTDDVAGVPGVGEITASKFLQGKLSEKSKAYLSIIENETIWKTNLKIVRLPFSGTAKFMLDDDDVTPKRWNKIVKRLGMDSLVGWYKDR